MNDAVVTFVRRFTKMFVISKIGTVNVVGGAKRMEAFYNDNCVMLGLVTGVVLEPRHFVRSHVATGESIAANRLISLHIRQALIHAFLRVHTHFILQQHSCVDAETRTRAIAWMAQWEGRPRSLE
jgi:hypothetical protein